MCKKGRFAQEIRRRNSHFVLIRWVTRIRKVSCLDLSGPPPKSEITQSENGAKIKNFVFLGLADNAVVSLFFFFGIMFLARVVE